MPPTAGASGKSLGFQESTTTAESPTTNAPAASFHGAHHFTQHSPTFIDSMHLHQANVISGERSGMAILLDRTINDVFHDSSTHKPACHAGTRVELIDEGVNWGRGASDPDKALFWIDGPAGVGKSSIGQSCAEILGKENRLGAAVFFSRPNGRDDPSRLFTSIAYRLATQFDPYREIVEQRIQKDPTVVTLSMQNQFRELLERPLQVLGESHHLTAVEGWVIVIDGLDECNGTEGEGNAGETHRDIVKIIATSVHARGTPFRWMILSRSEPSIVAAFKDAQVSSITIHKPLRISREIDNEIEHVIKEELTRIGKESGLSSSWFSESDVKTLVELCAGLWAYEATIVRFIAMKNSTGPASQLRIVLDFAIRQRATGDNPLEALDAFYTLIINSVPAKTLPTAQRIIILTVCGINQVLYLSYILGISEAEIEYACGTLHAVLDIRTTRRRVTFHHASFTDYIKNRERSGDLCVSGQVQKDFWQDMMKRMLEVACVRQKGKPSFLHD
ncbi:hypothetical protein D9756_009167 [Leucocoprinus leucothites]|uniref:Nephrocystin 3-like N-terminal domain-containing protein n=1 Tax=Leucocoprinus leucothites TaxID=201217 RepID=A0A8H5FVD2_9AGAR|nr:hypothetical protein D9756_009167 [Leucoagaricus leucothites]